MKTSYREIYECFFSKITDYAFLEMTEEDLEVTLLPLLHSSVVKFKKCRNDIKKRDELNKTFNTLLTDEEKEIMANLMVVEYLTPKIITSDLLQQTLSSKDFKLYSQANHIKEVRELRDYMKHEVERMILSYSYDRDLSGFR